MTNTNGSLHDQASSSSSPSFVGRLLALPPLNDALTLTTSLYQRTKEVKCVGVVVGAAENSFLVAVTGVMPLATPILHSVSDWEALDKWACRGLDTVEQMAPIVTKPTSETVKDVRGLMLGLLAGTTTDDPPFTLTSALTARVQNTVELVSGSRSGRAAACVTGSLLNVAHILLDHYLPPGEGDLQESNGRAGGVVTKASTLAHKTRRRLYRATHNVVHPHHPECHYSTPTQLVVCVAEAAREWYWTPSEDHQTTVARVMLSLSLEAWIRLSASIHTLLRLVSSFNPRCASYVVLRHDLADKTRALLLHLTIFCMVVEDKVIKIWEWSEERLRGVLASWEQRGRAIGSLEERQDWHEWLTAHLMYQHPRREQQSWPS